MPGPADYERLRSLVSPIVAITTRRDGERNGLIVNSAMRASLSPEKLRVAIIVHKFNHSHDMVFESGVFAAHILRAGDLDLVVRLGCASGRDQDKLAGLTFETGPTGAPLLMPCYAYYDCEVVNAMDTGASTIFLGAAVAAGGDGTGEIMRSADVRGRIPAENADRYAADLVAGQRFSTEMADKIRPLVWPGLA